MRVEHGAVEPAGDRLSRMHPVAKLRSDSILSLVLQHLQGIGYLEIVKSRRMCMYVSVAN